LRFPPSGSILSDMLKDKLRQFITETLADYADEQTMADVDADDMFTSIDYESENLVRTKKRREIKQLWNKYADHAFFDDSKQLSVFHVVGKYGMETDLKYYFDITKEGRIPGIDIPAKDELSCAAYLATSPGSAYYSLGRSIQKPHFTFKRKRVTFASFYDVASEWLSLATDEDKEFYKSSGLPKRPESTTPLSSLPLGKDDIQRGHNPPRVLQEVIIDNWIIDTFFGHEKHREEAEKFGLKFELL